MRTALRQPHSAPRPFHVPRTALRLGLALCLLPSAFCRPLHAQTTAFTYQGQLTDDGVPASAPFDFRITLHDEAGGGLLIAGPVTNAAVNVVNGLFTVALDFGPGVFTGDERWLEIGVRTNGGGTFTVLTPRQALSATPYAITAGNLAGTLDAAQLTGTIPDARFSLNVSLLGPSIESEDIADGTIQAVDVNSASFDTTFWRTAGNAGTTSGMHLLGTTDDQPLDLAVNNQRALRLEPAAGGAPNLVGGAPVNRVSPGVVGATIGGGGAASWFALSFTNEIQADFGVISGGGQNLIETNSRFATIGGGGGNVVLREAQYSTVSGGTLNRIENHSERATITGGWGNTIHSNANNATISGGQLHAIHSGAAAATIAGGSQNTVHPGAQSASIGGGTGNRILTNAPRATIGGGAGNTIHDDAIEATVAGGGFNLIEANARTATIGGGGANRIGTNAFSSTIGGGIWNVIEPSAFYATLGGGQSNRIQASAQHSTIGGGAENIVLASGQYATIPGGRDNRAGLYAFAAGQRAKADHVGTFVWADWTAADFPSTAANQFLIRAAGGVGINKNNPVTALDVNGTVQAGAFQGGGAGLTGVNATSLGGLSAANFWQLGGNAGTTPGTHFLGTTDHQPLEFKVSGARVWRFEDNGDGAPNVLGGSPVNLVSPGVIGATISGGGTTNSLGVPRPNTIAGDYATIGGGLGNTIQANGRYATIGGGDQNAIQGAWRATIGGGFVNEVGTGAQYSAIAGGYLNSIGTSSESTAIAGGRQNRIESNASGSAIGGGRNNIIATQARDSAVAGGYENRIETNSAYSAIGGGWRNVIASNSWLSTIAGGHLNTIGQSNYYSAIGGGRDNSIGDNARYATLAGGYFNVIGPDAYHATIGGGRDNTVGSDSQYATLMGGYSNQIGPNAWYTLLGGGQNNTVGAAAWRATLVGGYYNSIGTNGQYGSIGGGSFNILANNAVAATIPGGADNFATNYALAAGRRAKASHTGAFVWADSQFADFSSTLADQFNVRAAGGVRFVTSGLGINLSPVATFHVNSSRATTTDNTATFINSALGPSASHIHYGTTGDWYIRSASTSGRVILQDAAAGARVGVGRAPTANKLEVEGDASKTTAGSWLANSDARIKTDIQPVTDALAKLERVNLVSFRYTEDYRAQHPGVKDCRYLNVVAQEFREVFPEHVTSSGETLPDGGEILQVDTYPLTIYAAAAVRELNQKLEQKQNEISELRNELSELKALVQTMNRQLNSGAQ